MLITLRNDEVVLQDNSDEDFDGIAGVYHTIGVMSTSDTGTVFIEYRVRGLGKWHPLPVIDLTEVIEAITFTAPVTHWRVTTEGITGPVGITTFTDTQVKSSAGLVDTLRREIDGAFAPINHTHDTFAPLVHEHDYAEIVHSHDYAEVEHEHVDLANVVHTHPEYENQFVQPIEVELNNQLNFTYTHNRGYEPLAKVKNALGQECFPAYLYPDLNTITVHAVVALNGTLTIY